MAWPEDSLGLRREYASLSPRERALDDLDVAEYQVALSATIGTFGVISLIWGYSLADRLAGSLILFFIAGVCYLISKNDEKRETLALQTAEAEEETVTSELDS